MSPYAVGHRLLFMRVAGMRNGRLGAERVWGQPSRIAIQKIPMEVPAYMVGVSTLPETIKQLANSHFRLMPMRFASGRVKA